MRLKICMMLCISAAIISFPKNIIGCGPDADPYDYYTSFFSQRLASVSAYKPFYYTGYNFLYDEAEPVLPADLLAKEWAAYAGSSELDAKAFVTEYSFKDVNNLYYNIEKAQPLKIPDSMERNGMTKYFAQQKDIEALGYILYAKQVQPYVTGDPQAWEPIQRDTVKMQKLIKNGLQLYAAARKENIQLKYAYQVIRLAHYSQQYDDAIKYYDSYVPQNKTLSILQPMCLALKAGALYRTGKTREAAYLFSKVFLNADVNKVSNYISFFWCVDAKADRASYVAMGKTNEEKAALLAIFALGSPANEMAAMQEIYRLQPKLNILEVLATREINKLEETYFTPQLSKQNGGKQFYYTWDNGGTDSVIQAGAEHLKNLTEFLVSVAKNGSSNNGLFETAAAYTSFILRDYAAAKQYLAAAKKMDLTPKVQDQWALTNLLVTINEKNTIDADFEAEILPSIKWLKKKADDDKVEKINWYEDSQWKIFYRNVMSEIVAKRYHAQGDLYKEALAIGNAERVYNDNTYNYNALDYLRNKLVSADVEKLYALMSATYKTAYDAYLINNNSLKTADVIDFAGTAYLRDYKYGSAIQWFNKSPVATKKHVIGKDPFIELLFDQEEKLDFEKKTTTKLAFAQEMLRLQKTVATDKINAAKNLYKMALGMYNMTYYGHAWELVQYYRGGTDGYYIPPDATAFQKEYYGCYMAHDYFKKAMAATADKNLQAKCLFMMAKCTQKLVRQPQYSDFGYGNYDRYDSASKLYFPKFKYNEYFPRLVKEYSSTAFYKEALSSCSYLSDFVHKK